MDIQKQGLKHPVSPDLFHKADFLKFVKTFLRKALPLNKYTLTFHDPIAHEDED